MYPVSLLLAKAYVTLVFITRGGLTRGLIINAIDRDTGRSSSLNYYMRFTGQSKYEYGDIESVV